MILLDTHVLIWLSEGDARLGRRARRRIESALRKDEVFISAFSFWELGHLLEARRLRSVRTPEEFRVLVLERGIVEVAVDGEIAILSTRLSGMHADPVDRIIVATALGRRAALVTADQKILAMKSGPERVDAQV